MTTRASVKKASGTAHVFTLTTHALQPYDIDENDGGSTATPSSGQHDDGEDEEEDNDEDDDGPEDDEDDFFLDPPEILQNARIKKMYLHIRGIIEKKRTPQLETLLSAPISDDHKADLLEMFVLYSNCEPYSEEYYQYRNTLNQMHTMYMNDDSGTSQDMVREFDARIQTQDVSAKKILTLDASMDTRHVLYEKYKELCRTPVHDEEHTKLKKWLVSALSLPFNKVTRPWTTLLEFSHHMNAIRRELDSTLYGMKDVKEQILLLIHTKVQNPEMTGCSLGLVGPPGVGKTTIARCLSRILQYPFQQISFGGMNHSELLKGHQYTYIGSGPGEIARSLMNMQYSNGILFFDEFEKATESSDIISTLLHVTDVGQNMHFRDNYFSEIDIDLSRIWFVYSMNTLPEDSALRDRIFSIRVPGYTQRDKVYMVIHYFFPKHLSRLGFQKEDIQIDDAHAQYIITTIQDTDKGVRQVEKAVGDVCRKLSFMYHHHEQSQSMSFALKERITLPYTLTRDVIDVCLRGFNSNDTRGSDMMYV